MEDYDARIRQIQEKIQELTAQLASLEAEREAYREQLKRRRDYLSSREILELLEQRHGRKGSMASIKRWADCGYLGEVVEEREAFPLLARTQGHKRFLYPRKAVFRFFREKGLLRPRYEVLDRVCVQAGKQGGWAMVTAVMPDALSFSYQVQLEETGEVLTVLEEDLALS